MRKSSLFVLTVYLFAAAISGRAQQQNTHYVYNGTALQVVEENLAFAKYHRWQVWLYQEGVRIPRHTAGLQYSRWGLIEGSSAENVMSQLRDSQSFEEAYLRFFGSGTWGWYSFSNPVGPIAVTDRALEDQDAALEKLYQLRWLQDRVNRLIASARPSLENNESYGPVSPVKEYFDQIREALLRVSKLHSQLSHSRPQLPFIESGITQAKTQVAQAESNVPKITAVLPSVKLPTSKSWMSHAERAGRDGSVLVEVTETESGVSVQQTWMGGDGSMTGTVIVTTIPYNDIGTIDFERPTRNEDDQWTVRVESAAVPFPQILDSPPRKTSKRTFPAVHSATTENQLYFVFPKAADARDAYAYLLYHKQLGR